MKFKILYFETGSGYGGSANALAGLVNCLDRSKFDLVVTITNFGSQTVKIKDTEVIMLKGDEEPEALLNIQFLFYFLKNIIPQAIKLYFLIKRKGIVLVHANNNIISGIPAIIAAKLAGAPCVCHIRQTRALIKREKLFARWVDKFIVLNKIVYKMLRRDIPEKRISIVYDGVDFNEFTKNDGRPPAIAGEVSPKAEGAIDEGVSLRKELNLGSAPIVAIIGRITEGKGHKEFVSTACQILKEKPSVKFVIIGDAKGANVRYCEEVHQLVEKESLKENIIFAGWWENVGKVIADFDLVVQPYTSAEGLPNVLIEAMAASKPVISTEISGPTEIVKNGENGFLVPPSDIKLLAEKITYLLDNPDIARKMGEAGRKRVEELFDIRKNVKQIEAVYEELLEKAHS